MSLHVTEVRDPVEAFDRAGAFLAARPERHNIGLTVLEQDRLGRLGGCSWIVEHGAQVVGYALQSPPGRLLGLAQMDDEVVRALADAVPAGLPGVIGDAAGAATFAGRYAERHHVGATPASPGRLYALRALTPVATAPGRLRAADTRDRDLLVEWSIAFGDDTGTGREHAEQAVDWKLATGLCWIWEDTGPVAMTASAPPAAGVARVQSVYTPDEHRRHGYATACVEHVSRVLTGRGLRCVLFTQLENPTANAIYRRLGYEPITEWLAYEFSPGGGPPGGGPAGGGDGGAAGG